MGLDLLLFQADKDGQPELIKQSQRARFKSEAVVDEIQEDYKTWTRGYFTLTIGAHEDSQIRSRSDEQRYQCYSKRNWQSHEGSVS